MVNSLNGCNSEFKFLSYSLTSTSPFFVSIDSKEGTKKFIGHFTLTALPFLSSKESVSISTTLPLSNGTVEIYSSKCAFLLMKVNEKDF